MSFIARFFLLVLVLSTAELYLLIFVSARISLGLTLLLCIFTGVLGGAMVRKQGLKTVFEIQKNLQMGKLPALEFASGAILLVIGTLLLTPGFITDTIAFLMLIPALRRVTAGLLLASLKKRLRNRNTTQAGARNPERIIIEVEAQDPDA